jgi:hypothetical protein
MSRIAWTEILLFVIPSYLGWQACTTMLSIGWDGVSEFCWDGGLKNFLPRLAWNCGLFNVSLSNLGGLVVCHHTQLILYFLKVLPPQHHHSRDEVSTHDPLGYKHYPNYSSLMRLLLPLFRLKN